MEIRGLNVFKDALFFDLEHYIYKKPICIGVFGCCFYDKDIEELKVTQYMIENKTDAKSILKMAEDYFINMWNNGKRYIVTFSGNNDFTVINYLFKKYKLDFDINEHFFHIDLQRQYEKEIHSSIGLKALEKEFGIVRESEVISGSNLAKTFSKIVKDNDYINRMPEKKKEKILLYNEQDVVSLFDIYVNWKSVFKN
nr:ribonuclease H-like domain-containing protein [Clostridium tyrobutyricum]